MDSDNGMSAAKRIKETQMMARKINRALMIFRIT